MPGSQLGVEERCEQQTKSTSSTKEEATLKSSRSPARPPLSSGESSPRPAPSAPHAFGLSITAFLGGDLSLMVSALL